MNAYIQDLCGDEDPLDIDVAIIKCILNDAIYEQLIKYVGHPITEQVYQDIEHTVRRVCSLHL